MSRTRSRFAFYIQMKYIASILFVKKSLGKIRRFFRNLIINIISSDDGQSEAEAILIVLLRKGLHHIVYSLAHLGGSRYFHLAAKAADPAIELVTDADGDIKMEAAILLG